MTNQATKIVCAVVLYQFTLMFLVVYLNDYFINWASKVLPKPLTISKY